MPPRVCRANLLTPQVLPSPPHRCQCICQTRARQLSSTPRYATRVRDDMFRWLNGPGAVFRHPLPGSTNYLNAYDRDGNLIRAPNQSPGKTEQKKEEEDDEINEDEDEEIDDDGEIVPKKTEEKKRVEVKETKEGPRLPKEKAEDLRPFPMNRQFRSQPVLSEELKDAIYEEIMEKGQSVRSVSADLGVEMNRVGAVVRLKAVEKEWEKQVCHLGEDALVFGRIAPGINDEKTQFD